MKIAERAAERPCGYSGETPQTRRIAWLGRQDSNLRMAASKAAALPLGDAPTRADRGFTAARCENNPDGSPMTPRQDSSRPFARSL